MCRFKWIAQNFVNKVSEIEQPVLLEPRQETGEKLSGRQDVSKEETR